MLRPYEYPKGRPDRLSRSLPVRSRVLDGLACELAEVEVMIKTLLVEELLVGAFFDDFAVVDDEDLVGVADGGEAVGDDEGGAALHEAQQGFLDVGFGAGVDAAGGLIEDED